MTLRRVFLNMVEVFLKPTTADDYNDYYRIRSSPADIYWNGYESAPNIEKFRELYLNRLGDTPLDKIEDRRLYLIQIQKEENVGFVQLIKREDGIDISYTVIEKYQGHGYASKALSLGVRIALELDDRVYVQIRDDNISSQRVALKCGFTKTEEYESHNYPKVGIVALRKYRFIKRK